MADDLDNTIIPPEGESAPAPASEPKAVPISDSIRAAIKTVSERARTPDGKFVKAEEAPEPAAPAEKVSTPQDKTTTPAAPAPPEGVQPPAAIEPPAAVKGLLKATDWAKLPPQIREALASDLKALDGHVPEKVKGDYEFGRAVKQNMAAREHQWRLAGFQDETQALNFLFRMNDLATTNLPAYLGELSRMTGRQITIAPPQPGQQAPQQPQIDPVIQQVDGRLRSLESTLQAEAVARIDAQIKSFAETKDEKGNPKFPHFEQVRATMGRLLDAKLAATLEDAYDKAVFQDSTLRDQIINQRTVAAQQTRAVDQQRAAAEAKRSASPVRGAPGGAPPPDRLVAGKGEGLRTSIANAIRHVSGNA